MKKAKLFGVAAAALVVTLTLGACGNNAEKGGGENKTGLTVALITDTGGIDDKSFNQSAWEGLQKWGEENGVSEGKDGYEYFQSATAADHAPNIDQAVKAGYKMIIGVGFALSDPIQASAKENADKEYVIIDNVIEGEKNVVSAIFKDNESSYLAGIAAGYTTKTNKVGFIGGVKGETIDRFEAGYKAGVKAAGEALGKDITVVVQYAGDWNSPDKGKTIAQGMYAQGCDVIFHAAGGTGTGVFQEAIAENEQSGGKDVKWVIGVDRDQTDEGVYKVDGKEMNCCLCSTVKGVNTAVIDLCNKAAEGKFPGGETINYGLKEDGVSLTDGQLSKEAIDAVKAAREDIVSGKITVPETPEK